MTDIPKRQFDASLNAQHTEATIDIGGVQFVATAEQLESAIRDLANLRAQMKPEASQEIDPGLLHHIGPFRLIHQSNSEGQKPIECGAFLLGLSSGLGWVQLYLSEESCCNISSWLNTPHEKPPSTTLN